MGNIRRWEMYNPQVKEKFLDTQIKNKKSRDTYEITLGNISEFERSINKNLYDMNIEEVKSLFETLTTNTLISVSSIKSRLIKYISWAMLPSVNLSQNGLMLSLLMNIEDEDLVSVVAMENQYITAKEKDILVEYCKNFQDKALVMLSFRGVSGVDMSEMTNLKYSDLNFETNEIHLHGLVKRRDKDTKKTVLVQQERTLKLSKEEMNLLELAYKTTTYWNFKEHNRDKTKPATWVTDILVDNKYIFRKTQRKTKDDTVNEPIRTQVLMLRLKTLVKGEASDFVGIQKPQVVFKTLLVSGMLNELKMLGKNPNEITDEDYKAVVTKFNSEEYNFASLKKLHKFMVKRNMKFVKTDI
jgi:integrase